jgi:hypothetical protein
VGEAQVCNAADAVPEERTGTEGVSNNISGGERLSPLAWSSPASETDAGNIESKKLPDREVRNEATNAGEIGTQMGNAVVTAPGGPSGSEEGRKNISGAEHLTQLTGSSPAHKVCREDVEPTQHVEAADGDRVEEEDKKKTVNKKTSTVLRKMEVMTIMVMMMMRRIMVIIKRTAEMMTMRVMAIVRRMLEIMTMRVMVIIMRMTDTFVENCPGN